MKKTLIAAATLGSLVFTPQLLADQEHYVNLLLGGRAMGMGGAYTAISDDPAGLFYNPAGIVYAHSANLSASVNAFRYSSKTYERVLSGGIDWSRESSGLVPNYFGVTQPFGPFTVGFSYAVTDSSEEDQAQTFKNLNNGVEVFTINVNESNSVNKIGPSIAYQANENFAIGLTLYLHMRDSKTIVNQYVQLPNNTTAGAPNNKTEWINTYSKNKEYGVTPKLGVIWSPTDKLALAATYSQNFVINSSGYSQQTCLASYGNAAVGTNGYNKFCDPAIAYAQQSAGETSNTHSEDPFELRFGSAYFATNSLLLSADLSYHSEVSGKLSVVNFAGGAEYYTSPELAIRAGIFSNMSNAPTPTTSNTSEKVDYFGGAFSLTRFNKNSSVSGGINFQYGTGTSSAVASGRIVDVSSLDMTFFLSTAYSY
ncbi:long-chain fatty acid transport protein [Oceanospirillum multiglobuliferum]|uniref:Aromatic hydrocarbon degradation protein n=1 Tax=Oceanospirillum multiglobuliferum TaxID=64969 RepID=A0A1T4MRC6_9GAMM|nr:outer membrane protein transport protein [Oceanospirillum multiglobuliferum]OPX56922.1 hypothetical protein BTE48_00345 [Oceanospirillum multiglobuliferum]SJZ69325.1 long-chain fatty acid transport protein [Oceanospirillum multiglobuliferum]